MRRFITLILIPINLILGYFVYDSINSEVVFNKDAKIRIQENVQKLKDLRQIQIKYKQEKGVFADNFDTLISFLKNDSVTIVEAIGQVPDSLSEEQALKDGLITRVNRKYAAIDIVFDSMYRASRLSWPLDENKLTTVPHSNSIYNINAGQIEKGNVTVQVFEISTSYRNVFAKLEAENRGYELNNLLKVGSMEEASINGNWGE